MRALIIQEEPGDMTHYSHMIVYDGKNVYVYPHYKGTSLRGYICEPASQFVKMNMILDGKDVREQERIVLNNPYWMEASVADERENPFTVASAIRCAAKAIEKMRSIDYPCQRCKGVERDCDR